MRLAVTEGNALTHTHTHTHTHIYTHTHTHMHAGMSIRLAVAEGNALGKGPLVYHMRPHLIAAICVKSARGDEDAQVLERALFRYRRTKTSHCCYLC